MAPIETRDVTYRRDDWHCERLSVDTLDSAFALVMAADPKNRGFEQWSRQARQCLAAEGEVVAAFCASGTMLGVFFVHCSADLSNSRLTVQVSDLITIELARPYRTLETCLGEIAALSAGSACVMLDPGDVDELSTALADRAGAFGFGYHDGIYCHPCS